MRLVIISFLWMVLSFNGAIAHAQSAFNVPQLDNSASDDVPTNNQLNDILQGDSSALFNPSAESENATQGFCQTEGECSFESTPDFESHNVGPIDPNLADDLVNEFNSDFHIGELQTNDVGVEVCVPPDGPVEGMFEYRCDEFVEVVENLQICERVIRAGLSEEVVYSCPATFDEQGNRVLDPSCAQLLDEEGCEESGFICSSNSNIVSATTCVTGSENASYEAGCDIETFHIIEVFESFDCELYFNAVLGELLPNPECEQRVTNRECSTEDTTCLETVNDEDEVRTCLEGESVDDEQIECSREPQYVAQEQYVWTVSRDFQAPAASPLKPYRSSGHVYFYQEEYAREILEVVRDCDFTVSDIPEPNRVLITAACPNEYQYPFFIDGTGSYVSNSVSDNPDNHFVESDDFVAANAANCVFGDEVCAESEPVRPRSLTCDVGEVLNTVTLSCESQAIVNIDEDYVYESLLEYDDVSDTHVLDSLDNALRNNSACTDLGQECHEVAPIVYETFECVSGFIEENVPEFCNVPVDIVIDHDYVYSGRRTLNVPARSFINDASLNTLEAQECREIGSECVVQRPPVLEEFVCRDGYERVFADVTNTIERDVIVDSDYRYLATRSFNEATSSFVNSNAFTRLEAQTGSVNNCVQESEVCLEESGGVFSSFECRDGYREIYGNESCTVPAVNNGGLSYIYETTGDYNFTSERRVFNINPSPWIDSNFCSLSSSECLVETPLVTEEEICREGEITTYVDTVITSDLEFDLDFDYVYEVNRSYDLASGDYIIESRYNGIESDQTCESLDSSCSNPYDGPLRGYSCQVGDNVEISRERCIAPVILDVDPEYVYNLETRSLSGDAPDNLGDYARLSANSQCQLTNEICSTPTPNTFDEGICTIEGLGDIEGNVSCVTGHDFTTRLEYEYRWDYTEYSDGSNDRPVTSQQLQGCEEIESSSSFEFESSEGSHTCHTGIYEYQTEAGGSCTFNVPSNFVANPGHVYVIFITIFADNFINSYYGGTNGCDIDVLQTVGSGYELARQYGITCPATVDNSVVIDYLNTGQPGSFTDSGFSDGYDDFASCPNNFGHETYESICLNPVSGGRCTRVERRFGHVSKTQINSCDFAEPTSDILESSSNEENDFGAEEHEFITYSENDRVTQNRYCESGFYYSGTNRINRTCSRQNGESEQGRVCMSFSESGSCILERIYYEKDAPVIEKEEFHEEYWCPHTISGLSHSNTRRVFDELVAHDFTGLSSIGNPAAAAECSGLAYLVDEDYDCTLVSNTARGNTLTRNGVTHTLAGGFGRNHTYQCILRGGYSGDTTCSAEVIDALENGNPDIETSEPTCTRTAAVQNILHNFQDISFWNIEFLNREINGPIPCEEHTIEYVKDVEHDTCDFFTSEFVCSGSVNNVVTVPENNSEVTVLGYDYSVCEPQIENACHLVSELGINRRTEVIEGQTLTTFFDRRRTYDCDVIEPVDNCTFDTELLNERCVSIALPNGEQADICNYSADTDNYPTEAICQEFDVRYQCEDRTYGTQDFSVAEVISEAYVARAHPPTGNDCRITRTDFTSLENRIIEGLQLSRRYEREDTYTCGTTAAFDSCNGLRAEAISESSRCVRETIDDVCELYEYTLDIPVPDPSGGCDVERQEYSCSRRTGNSNALIAAPNNTIENGFYTELCDITIGRSDSCILQSSSCSGGSGFITADGSTQNHSCLNEVRNYQCIDNVATASCNVPAGYELFSSSCAANDRSGACTLEDRVYRIEEFDPSLGCHEYEYEYFCEEQVATLSPTEVVRHVEQSGFNIDDRTQTLALFEDCTRNTFYCAHDSSTSTRNIDGLDVTFACWDFIEDWTCYNDTDFNECNGAQGLIASQECIAELNGVCTAHSVTYENEINDGLGSCSVFEETYICDDEISSLSLIRRESEFDSATRDTSACENIDDGFDSCERTQILCVDEGPIKNIEGVDVTLDCFDYQYVYECFRDLEEQTCTPPNGSEFVSRECLSHDRFGACTLYDNDYRFEVEHPSGGCLTYRNEFLCEDPLGSYETLRIEKHEDGFVWDDSSCTGLEDNGQCSESIVCSSGSETRNIEGVSVTRDCWEREHTFSCGQVEHIDSCDVPSYAELQSETCSTNPLSSSCSLVTRNYRWNELDASGGCHSYETEVICNDSEALSRPHETVELNYVSNGYDTLCPTIGEDTCFVESSVCTDGNNLTRLPNNIIDTEGNVIEVSFDDPRNHVSRDCWAEDLVLNCESTSHVDECSGEGIDEDELCTAVDQVCVEQYRSGECALYEYTYVCSVPLSGECVSQVDRVECGIAEDDFASLEFLPKNGINGVDYFSNEIVQLAANDNIFASPDASNNNTQYRVEVTGEGQNILCNEDQFESECSLLSEVCVDAPNTPPTIQRTQDEFFDNFIQFAGDVDTECFNFERTYSCEFESTDPLCGDVSECTTDVINCAFHDEDGNCLSEIGTYLCEDASCESAPLVYDERAGDNRYSGHHYLCELHYEASDTRRPLVRGGVETTITGRGTFGYSENNACFDYEDIGCEVDRTLIRHLQTDSSVLVEPHEVGTYLVGDRTTVVADLVADVFCPFEVSETDELTYQGYIEAISGVPTEPNSSDCEVIDVECTDYRLDTREFHELDYCGRERITYSCFEEGDGSLCEGTCLAGDVEFVCDSTVDGVGEPVSSDSDLEISDVNSCFGVASDDDCHLIGSTCVEGPEERIIDGIPVFEECWRFEETYSCIEELGTVDTCEPPEGCELVLAECVANRPDGSCTATTFTYDCTPVQSEAAVCEDEEQTPYTDPNDNSDDEPGLFDIISAVDGTGDGIDHANQEPTIYGGTRLDCSRALAGIQNCCGFSGPLLLLGCNGDEQRLQQARQEEQCFERGSYCSKRALFFCRERSRAFCCYDSELNRIIAEAGNEQLDRDIGSGENLDCSGFTFEQFQQLDLSQVDFSGVANDVVGNANTEAGDSFNERLSNSLSTLQNNNGFLEGGQ